MRCGDVVMRTTQHNGAVRVRSDGTTVWVDAGPYTVARFGRLGIDVHTADSSGCLHCTHEPTDSLEKWQEFVEAVMVHHYIDVTSDHMPNRVRATIPGAPGWEDD